MMPRNIVLVRHGESEGNAATKAAYSGDTSLYTPEFRARMGCDWRLTDAGREQADTAARWLHANGPQTFQRFYVSDYARAKETAVRLGFESALWFVEPTLRERDYGVFDTMPPEERARLYADNIRIKELNPYYWKPPGGESIPDVILRLRAGIIDTLHRECSDDNVLLVCHGQVMWGMLAMLTRMLPFRYNQLVGSPDPRDQIHNCQIVQFSREDPTTGESKRYLDWMRSVCPPDLTLSRNAWQRIHRPKYTNEELQEQVDAASPGGAPPRNV